MNFLKFILFEYIKRLFERLFNFDLKLTSKQENTETIDLNIKEKQEKSELLEFFKIN